MKLKFFEFISVALCVVMLAVTSFLPATASVKPASIKLQNTISQYEVENNSEENEFDFSKVLEARFLNMLNHNFVYDTAFENVESIVNESIIALLDMRDAQDDSYISESIASDYIYNMYGINGIDFSQLNSGFPYKQGYVYIIPRGFSVYNHEIVSVVENEDGSFTVKTNVSISTHDGCEYVGVAETLFVKNTESQFGYNIVYCNISDDYSVAV